MKWKPSTPKGCWQLLGMATAPSRWWSWERPTKRALLGPLLGNRGLLDGQTAVHVCRHATYLAPVTEPEGLRTQLES